jgi:transposase InsO family protein
VLQRWLKERGIVARFIEPGSPWQNGVNESFNGRFRDECLNRELLESAPEAQVIARDFRDGYNDIRLHSSLEHLKKCRSRLWVGLDRRASRVGAVVFTNVVYHHSAEGPAVPPYLSIRLLWLQFY